VALAQELFSMPADVAEEGDELGAERRSRPGLVRKTSDEGASAALSQRGQQPQEGQLARMVRELHELEDDIVTKLTAAERLLVQLGSRRIHEDAGYTSQAEFEERMLASTPVLRAMREALPPTPVPSAKLSIARRDPADARTRQTKALTSIARALERFRGIDREIHQCAAAARSRLCTIEGMRIFDECGYASFEEFLERALGPSPVLASVVALVADRPLGPQAGESPAPANGSLDGPSSAPALAPALFNESPALFNESPALFNESPALFDEAPALFDEAPALFNEAPALFDESPGLFAESAPASADTAILAASPGQPTPQASISDAAPARRRLLAGIIVSVVLCAAATVGGAAAGVWSGLAFSRQPAGERAATAVSVAAHSTAPGPSANAAVERAASATPGHDSARR
jgi:hypothetical protein